MFQSHRFYNGGKYERRLDLFRKYHFVITNGENEHLLRDYSLPDIVLFYVNHPFNY